MSSSLAYHWRLDPQVTHLNHGSFGATPLRVLQRQQEWRYEMEANPVRFMGRDLFSHLDAARDRLAAFIGAQSAALAFVPNASSGVNAVLRSLRFGPGDEILTTNHAYGAARNAANYVAERFGARLVTADVPMPLPDAEAALDAIVNASSPRTRLALIDHITSATALVLPIKRIVAALDARGIPTLVDGAHAPGTLDLDVTDIGAAYYVGNCHKWLCAPKGAGFLHIGAETSADLVPVVVGWGRTVIPENRSQFHADFDWVGTDDPTAYLCVPDAISVVGAMLPGGWAEVRARNHALALRGREILLDALDVPAPAPDTMIGSMAAVPLPQDNTERSGLDADPIETKLQLAGFEVPVTRGVRPYERWLRISAHLYNEQSDYERLARALTM